MELNQDFYIFMEPIEKDDRFIPDGMNIFEHNIKRVGGCILALGTLIVFSPLFLLCYIAMKRENGGPTIFKQERIGRFGRSFNIYEFHSMKLDAKRHGPALYTGEGDSRMTKAGRFLRDHHLDELPQFRNVLCGDMTFIGPRPEHQLFIDQIMREDPHYRYLFQIRPGIISYATPYNGYADTLEKMLRHLRYDLFYLEHRSWGLDIKILFMTFMSIVFEKKF